MDEAKQLIQAFLSLIDGPIVRYHNLSTTGATQVAVLRQKAAEFLATHESDIGEEIDVNRDE